MAGERGKYSDETRGKKGRPCFVISFNSPTWVVRRLRLWRTRLFSVLKVKDLMTRTVTVASVGGRAVFESDMKRR